MNFKAISHKAKTNKYTQFLSFLASLVLLNANAFAEEPTRYERIVSIGGSLTEIVYELGAENLLVAVDTTSTYPKSALAKHPNVGYMRALSAEPILSLNPDLVMVASGAGPASVFEQLRAAGTKVIIIEDEPSIDGVYAKVRAVSQLVLKQPQGLALVESLREEFSAAKALLSTIDGKPRVLFLLSAGIGAPMAAGNDTSANAMITMAGGTNIISEINGYKSISPESIVVGAPDFVLIPQHVFDLYGSKQSVFALPELIATPAAQAQQLLVFDGLYLLGFGPRSIRAILDLATALHPDFNFDESLSE
ncbi:MAG: iron complex transport system substrate-binding protein [Urechidicola sp.]|jgi:iron complex transport system substrate-binding protein